MKTAEIETKFTKGDMDTSGNYIQNQFCSYEIALKLKKLGFDEECFGYYTLMKDWMISTDPKYNTAPHFIGPNWCTEDMKMRFMYVVNSFGDRDSTIKNSGFTKAIHNIAVPLWQQVQSFLDDNGVIIGIIFVDNVFKYTLNTNNYVSNGFKDRMSAIKSATEHATNYLWDKKFNK